MAQKQQVIFNDWAKQKRQYKMKQQEFLNSIFSFGKLSDSSLTYFRSFSDVSIYIAIIYIYIIYIYIYLLYIAENINKTDFLLTTSFD